MALNQWMHPRNPYRDHKPNFKALAEKFPDFKKHTTTDEQGKVHLDFKDADCLRALTCALLLNDFGLKVELPPDRLVPTVPLRLNYILWLEDLLQAAGHADPVCGIDIGTGSSCVYPLLGSSKNKWKFLATESDATNYEYAQKNVKDNNLQDKVTVIKVTEGATLCELFQDTSADRPSSYDFCMCNPPFFGSNFEAWGVLTSRSEDRPQPMSVNTASPQESIVPGGEVQFVEAMIADSLVLRDKIRVYTTMLGKKASVGVLKEKLKRAAVVNIGSTEFCQGRTMRWGLAWTFNRECNFPKSPRKKISPNKKLNPLVCPVPSELSMETAEQRILALFTQLKMVVKRVYSSGSRCCWNVTAQENTWSHDRRRRREEERKKAMERRDEDMMEEGIKEESSMQVDSKEQSEKNDSMEEGTKNESSMQVDSKEQSENDDSVQDLESCSCGAEGEVSSLNGKRKPDKSHENGDLTTSKCLCLENGEMSVSNGNGSEIPSNKSESCGKQIITDNVPSVSEQATKEPALLSAQMILKKEKESIVLEMQWRDGKNKELLHQVLQYFKNHLK